MGTGRPAEAGWNFDNRYARLPGTLFSRVVPEPLRAARIAVLNRPLCARLGLDPDLLECGDGAALLAGNPLPPGAEPIAQAYAGHQYGHFTMLGDGRALLLGEQAAPDGARFDLHLKGSGRTPYSRGGDGRAALGPMLREWLVSEAMHAQGIPTTRALAVVGTGETVMRDRPLPGAILVRAAASHLRVGTFQYAAAFAGEAALRALVAFALERHPAKGTGEKRVMCPVEGAALHASRPRAVGPWESPSAAATQRRVKGSGTPCGDAGGEPPALALLHSVIERQADLIACWMNAGFVHGVMNTDNMAVSGETIDYGPCAFLDEYDPAAVFSSIDRHGRYAYARQPEIAAWNLARLAEALLPLIDADGETALALAREALGRFPERYARLRMAGLRRKLGFTVAEPGDAALAEEFLEHLKRTGADYTNAFRDLSRDAPPEDSPLPADPGLRDWHARHRLRLERDSRPPQEARRRMRAINPALIPRNHLVEAALSAAVARDDLAPARALHAALLRPFEEPAGHPDFLRPPEPHERVRATFCGT